MSQMKENKTDYGTIDLIRIISAIIVIGIHTYPLQFIDSIFVQKVIRLINEIAVPFFFITQGFFLEGKLQSLNTKVDKIKEIRVNIRKMVSLYLLWELIYLPFTIKGLASLDEPMAIKIIRFLHDLMFTGKFEWSFHLWYIIASIWALCFLLLFMLIDLRDGIQAVFTVLLFSFATFFFEKGGPLSCVNYVPELSLLYERLFGNGGYYLDCYIMKLEHIIGNN